MEKIFKCEFCDKLFSSKGNLSTHLNSAKYCISKRIDIQIKAIVTHTCDCCQKSFTTKQFLSAHNCRQKDYNQQKVVFETILQEKDSIISSLKKDIDIKLQEKDSIISSLKEQIESLQVKITSIAIEGVKKSTTVTNNNTNVTQILVPFNLEDTDLFAIVEHKLDETYFLNSQKGIAKFCVENILKAEDGKMRMICSDTSRERFKYMDEKGVVKDDIQARDFIQKLYPPIHLVGQKIHENIIDSCNKGKEDENKDQYKIKIKEEAAFNAWNNLRLIKNSDTNKTFRKELAILSNV